jgi:signal transduction histidine kinase
VKERVLLVRYGKQIPGWCSKAIKKVQKGIEKVYCSFDNIDFTDRNNKTILKIVLINALILTVITVLWFYGIVAVVIYSIILFFILRKYFNDLKDKYALLLNATNQMAEGNLNVEVTDDLGVFNPFKKELEKIQDGYQKAVDKEVKSQKMKTELITNMSHDLKTPLTAIITYVDLLKLEKDEEKRKEYIQILEKKSLRLKVLIEDLFEISKATSQTVILNKMDVDVVNLFKQVKLELDSRFEEAELSFRCTWPEEKLICELDSQKTYRIFENLLVNISKYAMHGTRVYTKVCREDNEAVIQLLNVSAAEITVKAEDLTERFVRGDVSRNTEGSGLGLAIARSFTELQQGTFHLTIEGDMFKVEVRFPLKAVKNVDNSPEFA